MKYTILIAIGIMIVYLGFTGRLANFLMAVWSPQNLTNTGGSASPSSSSSVPSVLNVMKTPSNASGNRQVIPDTTATLQGH